MNAMASMPRHPSLGLAAHTPPPNCWAPGQTHSPPDPLHCKAHPQHGRVVLFPLGGPWQYLSLAPTFSLLLADVPTLLSGTT